MWSTYRKKQQIPKSKETGDSRYIYQNYVVMAYGTYKGLASRIISHKVLCDKAFKIASSPQFNGYQRALVSLICELFDKKSMIS